MANYTTIDRVRGRLPNNIPLNEGSYPTKATAETWLTLIDNRVNVAWEQGGAVLPISDADQLGNLDWLCAGEAVYQVMVTRGAVVDPKNKPEWAKFHDEFEAALQMMRDGDFADAVTSAANLPWSPTMDADTADDTAKLPAFEKGMDL